MAEIKKLRGVTPSLPAGGPKGPGPKPGSVPVSTASRSEDAKAPALEEDKPQGPSQSTLAAEANLKKRHWGIMVSFVAIVLLPIIFVAAYLWGVAEDKYASTAAFTVRQEEGSSASDLLGIVQFAGGGGSSDSDILYEFIQSQGIVERIDARLDLRGHYSQHWENDKLFSIWPDAPIEDLLWYWKRVVRISYDQGAGLIALEVRAFDPDYARAVAEEIVVESQKMINELSTAAHNDATRYARLDLEESLQRLKAAREALTAFRSRTQIVDPEADIQGRMGVMNNLQQQLAQSLIEYDLLQFSSTSEDPRAVQMQQRIDVIRQRIVSERDAFTDENSDAGGAGEDYPSLIAEFERLSVDREYAEETYRASLAAFDIARTKAARLSRYLAPYIEPTRAQTAEYPQRFILLSLTALFCLLSWAVLTLVYYSIRDRR